MPKALVIIIVVVVVIAIGFLVVFTFTGSDQSKPPKGQTASSTVVAEKSGERRSIFDYFGFYQSPKQKTRSGGSTGQRSSGQLPHGFTQKDLSPYYGKITINKVSHPDISSLPKEKAFTEIDLKVDIGSKERVSISNWQLQSNTALVFIPQGSAVLLPGKYMNAESIAVMRGDVVKIYSHRAPLSVNFKLNKCTGYLNVSKFIPALPNQCPKIYESRSELSAYSAECQDYVLSLKSCEGPLTKLPKFENNHCFITLLKRAEYEGCFIARSKDADFLSKEWRVWLGSSLREKVNILNPRHDRVLLFDTKGLLVDEFFY